jgi:NAD(P)-dependent dehydrogenase (short-subunit alcohol dehydrogenase family)
MDLKIEGRRALVTGGSKGIGLAVATWLAREGCDVILVSRSQEELDSVALALSRETGRRVDGFACDLGAPGSAEKLAAAFPVIDILVNNAGEIPGGSIQQVDEAMWRASWDVKVFGYINLTREYFSRMQTQPGGGVIINVIGAAGDMLDAGYIAGSVGNAALMAFTRALGSSSAERGVRVVGVNPGPVDTRRSEKILRARAAQRLGSADRWRELEASFPLGRAATVDEIAASVALLASPLSGYTSGAILTIDGGLSLRRSIA